MRVALALSLLSLACACDDKKPRRPPPPEEIALAPMPKDARGYYAERCTQCHGATGQGDGPSGKNLQPWPRNFTNKEWQAAATDEQIRTIIVRGGAALGKSAAMPANPELESKPEIVAGLVDIVRGFGKK